MQVAMAQRLGERLPAGSYVAANDVGALSYLTRFRVLDLIGIISTRTLDKIEPAGSDPRRRQQAIYELLLEERPDAIVVFPRWYQPVMQALGESAIAIDEVYNPNNITSGGARLIAYRLKW